METTIRYTNSDYEPITRQQADVLQVYNKETYRDNTLKKVESYKFQDRTRSNVILGRGEYYLDQDESLQDITNQYLPTASNWCFYYNKQVNSNGDNIYEFLQYIKGIINSKRKLTFNNKGLLIASCYVDLITGELTDKWKFFYGDFNIYKRVDYEDDYLSVTYHEDSTVEQIYVYDEDYTLSEFLSSPEAKVFIWNNHPYYHNFEPMLP